MSCFPSAVIEIEPVTYELIEGLVEVLIPIRRIQNQWPTDRPPSTTCSERSTIHETPTSRPSGRGCSPPSRV